jgi:hypothetical protein
MRVRWRFRHLSGLVLLVLIPTACSGDDIPAESGSQQTSASDSSTSENPTADAPEDSEQPRGEAGDAEGADVDVIEGDPDVGGGLVPTGPYRLDDGDSAVCDLFQEALVSVGDPAFELRQASATLEVHPDGTGIVTCFAQVGGSDLLEPPSDYANIYLYAISDDAPELACIDPVDWGVFEDDVAFRLDNGWPQRVADALVTARARFPTALPCDDTELYLPEERVLYSQSSVYTDVWMLAADVSFGSDNLFFWDKDLLAYVLSRLDTSPSAEFAELDVTDEGGFECANPERPGCAGA